MNDHLIFFDGICHLCNSSVQLILQHDKAAKFRFASLQSPFATRTLGVIQPQALSSIVYLENGTVYTKSTAILRIAQQLPGAWKLLYAFIIVPQCIRDAVYNLIASNRSRWFGKYEVCKKPNKEFENRFIES